MTRKTKTLWVREPYLSQILAGRKTVEVRVGYDNIRRLQPGDRLKLNDEHLVTIRCIGRYADFEEMLAHEDPQAIAPDLPPDKLLDTIREIYPPDKEALGAVAIEIRLRRYDAILFDLGYTLIYFEPIQEVIVQEVLRGFGVEHSVDEIDAAVKKVWGEYFSEAATVDFPATEEYDALVQIDLNRKLLAQLGMASDEAAVQAFLQSIEAWFIRPGVMRSYPEVVEVLSELQAQGYRLGIISNWSWNLRDRVAQVELTDFFEIIWASAYAGCNKPHARIFDQAFEQMNLSPDRAFYVGDSYKHDVVGARNVGMDVAWLVREDPADDADCPVIRDLWGVFDLL
jgi:HAD superfamily hydrolase (TIGR01662 family)